MASRKTEAPACPAERFQLMISGLLSGGDGSKEIAAWVLSREQKLLGRYVDEFAFRLNDGDVRNHTLTRLDSFVEGLAGKRLTYKGA